MDDEYTINAQHNGKVQLEYLPCINYAMIHNHIPACIFCEIINTDNSDWNLVKVIIEGELIKRSEVVIDIIPAGQRLQIKSLEITPQTNKLIEFTEGIETDFHLMLTINGNIAFEQKYPISLMAFDQWTGSGILPELLAAFVIPNHPILSRIRINASGFLESWTGDSALDEYQTQDPNRVRKQVAAIYEALRSESLVYCSPPASFEKHGQRIRLADKVLTEKLGTCLDLTLLFASCLEANGIHPLLVLLKGHIFVGAWLTPDVYSQMISDDASFLLKGSADGINDLVLVETTTLTSSQNVPFEEAVHRAENELKEDNKFELFIDVFRCRLNNIRPLPQRINNNGSWEIVNTGIKHENATKEVNRLNRFEIKIDDTKKEITKQTIWERKLLDFSLRNNLINIRSGRRVIPFISFDIDHLEDHLQAGENYQILSSPTTKKIEPKESGMYDSSLLKDRLKNLVVNGLQNKKIHSYLTETELQNALKFIYRTSRTSLEENGANSLFLVLGIMKWFETERSVKPRFAPILLLPIDIIRSRGTTGYTIRTRDEDIILNITLVELLKQQYDINLSNLNQLPTDESGVDVKRIFATIRTCIRNMKRWDVIEESLLGLFSFNKFVMWNDIHSNADKLKKNPVIASLMENRIQWTDTVPKAEARLIDKRMAPSDFSIPVDVDSSQLEAVIESGEGKSFILYGPPGTGKSQTITNMIANALYKGKRVLFVAEKMAALSVVQNRLAKIGLDPFCLEMHSNKATKSHFLEQMQKAIEVTHIQSPAEYKNLSKRLFDHRKKLIEYMEVLHSPQTYGYSLYECITNYLSIPGDELLLGQSLPDFLNKEKLDKIREELISLDIVFQITGHPQDHPLKGLMPKDVSSESTRKLQQSLTDYRNVFEQIMEDRRLFERGLSLAVPDTFEGLVWMKEMCDILLKLPVLNKTIIEIAGNKELTQEWKEHIASGRKRDEIESELLKDFAPEILDENVYTLQQKWNAVEAMWFLPKFFAKRSYIKKIRFYNASLHENQIPGILNKLAIYHKQNKIVCERSQELADTFMSLGRKGKEKWDDILDTLNLAPKLYQMLLNHAQMNKISFTNTLSGFILQIGNDWDLFKHAFGQDLSRLSDFIKKHTDIQNSLRELCDTDIPDTNIETTVPPLFVRWLEHFDLIKNWYQWCIRKKELEKQHLSAVINYIESKHKTGTEASSALFKGVSHLMAIKTVDANKSLQMFNGLLFEEMINKYKTLASDFQELSKKELYCRQAARMPSLTMEVASNSEIGILKRNISNGGRGTSIRRIIDQIPTLLSKLCPCMLMSPISVAQYIDLNRDKFDIVIFDEASQMPTCEAVGAIARGNSLVVVGDPKQMPPTNFFSSSQVDEEDAEFDDMESILDDCISLSMPSRYLIWHYRSKHESLIAFSNSQYYEGKLHTFPSVDDRISKVKLIYVDGIYDKGHTRCNRAEADIIVKEIIRRLQDPELSGKSIGVISFSQVQQNLIEDLLLEEMSKYPELEQKAFQCHEPIFIKNLENVQGDERDVILFSIGYGPDKNGNVSMNFGPLNNQGGERRLNVAVSRARYEMIIFSTLHPEQIDLKRSKAKGVEGLKKFLEFAERGTTLISTMQTKRIPTNDLVNLIAQELENRGYTVNTFVGRSNFKVDLAIINPRNKDQYLLEILCDGKNYYETKTTRDREIVQPRVLNMLHWNIMRIWSIDWFENKEQVLDRITEKLETLQQENSLIHPAVSINTYKSFSIADEPVLELVNKREKEYIFADLPAIKTKTDIDLITSSPALVKKQLRKIISVEQPVTNTLLYKRILQIWNIPRITSRLQTIVDSQLTNVYKDPLSNETKIYWIDKKAAQNYTSYRINSNRDIQDIPIIEVMNAALYVIEQQFSMPLEDLKKVTSQVLGFSRKGANMDAIMEEAIRILIKKKLLHNNNGIISSKQSSN